MTLGYTLLRLGATEYLLLVALCCGTLFLSYEVICLRRDEKAQKRLKESLAWKVHLKDLEKGEGR